MPHALVSYVHVQKGVWLEVSKAAKSFEHQQIFESTEGSNLCPSPSGLILCMLKTNTSHE